jgi:hypothetical protein
MDDQTIDRMAQFLATEHSSLQAARSAVIAESNGRTTSFLTTISAGFVALALVSQIARFGEVFLLFSLVLISILGFIGISAYVRVVQLDFADAAYASAINRIHHFYLQTTPEIAPYLSFPAFDDAQSILRARVIYTSYAWTVLSYPSGLILVINSLLAGALCGLLVTTFFGALVLVAVGAGVIAFLLVSVVQYRLGVKWYADVRRDFQPRFPEPASSTQP